MNDAEHDLPVDTESLISGDTPGLKPGVKLPKNEAQWREADLYFRAELPISEINDKPTNECTIKMTNLVYDYFAENFGTVNKKNLDDEFDNKYANYTKQELKRELKSLKCQPNADVNNIRYVSQLLRRLSSRKNFTSDVNFLNDDKQISKNFWRYAKLKLEVGKNILPTFNLSSCTKYFINMCRSLFPTLTFTMPDWIPPLSTVQ